MRAYDEVLEALFKLNPNPKQISLSESFYRRIVNEMQPGDSIQINSRTMFHIPVIINQAQYEPFKFIE